VSRIEAVISDFGGVLTSPLLDSFLAFQEESGISPAALGHAMAAIAERHGNHPLAELETGRMSEHAFLDELGRELSAQLDREIEMRGFGEQYFEHLHPNEELIDYMRQLRERGYRLAICTNNVKEWEDRWRSMLPVDEIFDVVVDSAFVGTRKPEPRIYEITLELGIHAVQFQSNEQTIAEIESALA
jgi:putative hydrolase of the HAD superfamily